MWLSLVILGLIGLSRTLADSQNGRTTQENAEQVLEALTVDKQRILESLAVRGIEPSFLTGLRNRKLDIVKAFTFFMENNGKVEEETCGKLDAPIIKELLHLTDHLKTSTVMGLSPQLKKSIETTCPNYPQAVAEELASGNLVLTKNILLGLLDHLRTPRNVHTPDIVTLIENVMEIAKRNDTIVPKFPVKQNRVYEDILNTLFVHNDFLPSENYQILLLIASLQTIRPVEDLKLLLILKEDTFGLDVIKARDELLHALITGEITGEPSPGWETPPEKLLSLLTSLTANANDNPFVPQAHVVFAHFRHLYLTLMGYNFVPQNDADIAFLVNSFLTIRHPALLQEVYLDFIKLPWQTLLQSTIDYSLYSNPRVLFLDMIRLIMEHPEGLKICNTLLFNYFLNADDNSCPKWMNILPKQKPHPIVVQPPKSTPPPENEIPYRDGPLEVSSSTEKVSPCPNGDPEITIIDPDSLIDLLDDDHIEFIQDILTYNPMLAENYPYKTRLGVFKAILVDLKKKYSDTVKDYILTQAVRRMKVHPVLENLPPVLINICPEDLEIMKECEPPELTALPTVIMTEAPTIMTEAPVVITEAPPAPSTEAPCNEISLIDPDSLLDVVQDSIVSPAIAKVVTMMPIYSSSHSRPTKREVLRSVLEDRLDMVYNMTNVFITAALENLPVTEYADEPPKEELVCEDTLLNFEAPDCIEYEPIPILDVNLPSCTQTPTINPSSLTECLENIESTELLRNIIQTGEIPQGTYNEANRDSVLRAFLNDQAQRLEGLEALVVEKAALKLQFNEKSQLPVEYFPLCQKPTPDSSVIPDIFDVVPGVGEPSIPCVNETDNATEETTVAPIIEIPAEPELVACTDAEREAEALAVAEVGPNGTLGTDLLQSMSNHKLSSSTRNIRCKPLPVCEEDETLTSIVQTESLWNLLDNPPNAPYIRSQVSQMMIPLDLKINPYTKAQVLYQIFKDLRQEISDSRVLHNLDLLVSSIQYDGPGSEPPQTVTICIKTSALQPPTVAPCTDDEERTTVIRIDSLFTALSPLAPRIPIIRSKIKDFLIPVHRETIYTKGEVLRSILSILKNETDNEQLTHNIDVVTGFIREDGPALDEPDMVEVCLPKPETTIPPTTTTTTTTTEMPTTLLPGQPTGPCGLCNVTFPWPLLLKPIPSEPCIDPDTRQPTYAVLAVNIADLLDGADGSPAEIYMTAARLADLNTYHQLEAFPMEEYECSKKDFLEALAEHTGMNLKIRQESLTLVDVQKVCSKDLIETLPKNEEQRRTKRATGALSKGVHDVEEKQLAGAMLLANHIIYE